MSYINKIDLLIYNSINEIYNDIKDEKFKKLDSFGKEPEYEKIIHLANIANDPAAELNPNLSWEVNVLATYELMTKSIRDGVKHFIYSSSGSVYGVKKEKKV